MGTDTTPDLMQMSLDEAFSVARSRATWDVEDLTQGERAAVVLHSELDRLRARVAEMAAAEVRAEWGVRYPKFGFVEEHDSETDARAEWAESDVPLDLMRREVREYVGPWVPVEDEAGA